MKRAALLLTFLICVFATATSHAEDSVQWNRLGDDLEVAQIDLGSGLIFYPQLTLVRTSLKHYRVEAFRAETFSKRAIDVREMAQASRAIVGINANFFDEQHKPLGLIISRGNLVQGLHRGGQTLTGVFKVTRNSIGIASRAEFNAAAVVEAIQAGPRLLANTQRISGLRDATVSSRRAGVCIDSSNRLLFYVVSSIIGATLDQIQSALLLPGIGCVDALNLDGGGSAQLYISSELAGAAKGASPIYISGGDEVPVMLGLFQGREQGQG